MYCIKSFRPASNIGLPNELPFSSNTSLVKCASKILGDTTLFKSVKLIILFSTLCKCIAGALPPFPVDTPTVANTFSLNKLANFLLEMLEKLL